MADRVEDEDIVVEEEEFVEETDEDQEPAEEEGVVEEEESDSDEESDSEEEDEDDVVITFGDSAPEEEEGESPEAPGWVKKVRKVNRKLESENRKLRKMLEERSTEQTPPIELGEKPTLKSVGYDDKKYEAELAEYYERKRQVERQEAEKAKKAEEQQKQWQERQKRYVTQKETHGFKDFSDAEELVSNTFNITQQGIIVQGAEDSALVVYALGKNPKKLEELAKITDPVEFAFKVAKLEAQLKVTNKKAPAPEKRVSGSKTGGLSGTGDATLARLRAEAEKTGDYTKVAAYRRKKRNK